MRTAKSSEHSNEHSALPVAAETVYRLPHHPQPLCLVFEPVSSQSRGCDRTLGLVDRHRIDKNSLRIRPILQTSLLRDSHLPQHLAAEQAVKAVAEMSQWWRESTERAIIRDSMSWRTVVREACLIGLVDDRLLVQAILWAIFIAFPRQPVQIILVQTSGADTAVHSSWWMLPVRVRSVSLTGMLPQAARRLTSTINWALLSRRHRRRRLWRSPPALAMSSIRPPRLSSLAVAVAPHRHYSIAPHRIRSRMTMAVERIFINESLRSSANSVATQRIIITIIILNNHLSYFHSFSNFPIHFFQILQNSLIFSVDWSNYDQHIRLFLFTISYIKSFSSSYSLIIWRSFWSAIFYCSLPGNIALITDGFELKTVHRNVMIVFNLRNSRFLEISSPVKYIKLA